MKKKELERARQANSPRNTRVDTDSLRARVSRDLDVVKDAYDTGAMALVELSKLLAHVSMSDRPAKQLSELSKAYSDITKSLIALRGEGRTTIKEAVDSLKTDDPPITPVGDGEVGLDTPRENFLPPREARPQALGEFLRSNITNHTQLDVELVEKEDK